ncbi:MAG: phosphotransferase [Pseudomonadota bacterium]
MIDTRLTWITYFSPNPGKVVIVLPQMIEADTIKTLLDQCGEKGQPQIVQCAHSATCFSSLSQTQLDNLKCDTAIYLLQSRESFCSIVKKISLAYDCTVEEYSVFPGWKNSRWFVPRERSLGFGKMSRMIQPSRLIAKIAVTVFRFLKVLGKAHYLFPCRLIVAHNSNLSFFNFFEGLGAGVKTGIVYTGSFGPLQKFTVELLKGNDGLFAYAKFGQSEFARQAIQNERKALKKLATLALSKVVTPELIDAPLPETLDGRTLIIKKLDGGKQLQHITDTVISGLAELFTATQDSGSTSVREYTNTLASSLQELDCSELDQEFKKIRDDVVAILHKIATQIDNSIMLPLALSHGDFTRWNIRADEEKIYAIDWEEAAMRPPGHDLLSFLLAEYLLVTQAESGQVVPRIIAEVTKGILNTYIEKIGITKNSSTCDNGLLGIFFFSEVVRSNLWHIKMHIRYNYPGKKSLADLVKTSWACCLQLAQR